MSPEQICEITLDYARSNPAIIAGGITGSYARNEADDYSDIDLFFAHSPIYTHQQIMDNFTTKIEQQCGIVHYFDISTATSLYRAFLLPDWQELDIGVCLEQDFQALGKEPLKVIFGKSEPGPVNSSSELPGKLSSPSVGLDRTWVGYAWHHALHIRTSILRKKFWSALYWLNSLRDLLISKLSAQYNLPEHYAKGADRLPETIQSELHWTIPKALEVLELTRAFSNIIPILTHIIKMDSSLDELTQALSALTQLESI